jgi:beta-galactosidase
MLPVKVTKSESFPPQHAEAGEFDGAGVSYGVWLDHVETKLTPLAQGETGAGLLYHDDRIWLLTTAPDDAFLGKVTSMVLSQADVSHSLLPEDVRLRRLDGLSYAFNFGTEPSRIPKNVGPADGAFELGDAVLPGAAVAVWRS